MYEEREQLPANQPDIPDGPYTETCTGCSSKYGPYIDEKCIGCSLKYGIVLTCSHCERPCGARASSAIYVDSCNGVITNAAGTLACKPASAMNTPDGMYHGSCSGCTVTENQLACMCLDSSGQSHHSELDLTTCDTITVSISNVDGKLTCRCPCDSLGCESCTAVAASCASRRSLDEPGTTTDDPPKMEL